MKVDVVLAGVGGQGIITMGRVIGEACVRAGVNARVAETHGLSQRGGSVEVHVRIGDVDAPLVPLASADYVVSLEMLEALRALRYAKHNGWLIINSLHLPPVTAGNAPSKEEVEAALRKLPVKLLIIDATSLARQAGNPRAANMVMLGAMYATGGIEKLLPLKVVEETVEELLGPINRKALQLGYAEAKKRLEA